MANTTNFGWETPDDTDLVKDGAAAIRTLAGAIDTSMVDLKGGTTGQVLSKATNTDMDFTWVAQDDSNAIQNAIVDAKGDIIAATAADTPARLAVGANDTVLTADSSTATGLKWATPASGGGMTLLNSGSTSLSGVNTYTLSSISSSYTNLYVIIADAYHTASYGSNIWLRFNGDTGTNYAFSGVQTIDTTVSGDKNASVNNIFICNMNGSPSSTAFNRIAYVQCTIPLYANSFYKTSISQSYMGDATYTGNELMVGRWNNTAAITSITFLVNSGHNWSGNSSIYIYGVK